MSSRAAEVAEALQAHGYSLEGFASPVCFSLNGRRTLVSASVKADLCVFVQPRGFFVMQLSAARRAYPWMFSDARAQHADKCGARAPVARDVAGSTGA